MNTEDLKKAIAEYLETCEDGYAEEYFMTEREFADWQLELFVKWLEVKK